MLQMTLHLTLGFEVFQVRLQKKVISNVSISQVKIFTRPLQSASIRPRCNVLFFIIIQIYGG
jgi:hypothetical protein